MMDVYPIHLTLVGSSELEIKWSDGQERRYSFLELRNNCPCATCRERHKTEESKPATLLPVLSPAEGAQGLAGQAAQLDWQRLLQPFHEMPELRARWGYLQAAAVRVATILATADGGLTPRETAALKVIEDQFRSKQAPATDDAPLVLSSDVTADASSVCGPPERPEPTDVPPGPPQPTGEQTHAEAAFRLWEVKPLQLDSFVGQRSVTQAIRNWLDWGRFQSKRREAGVPYKTPDLHFVFVGRAGTGKSQVAQIVARSLRNNGFLKHADLVEADGFDLISGQPHEAIEAMKAKIKEAMGGMLLFDHAAVLLTSEDESGTAALRVLKKNLVAHANHFAVVLTSHSGCLLSLIDADPDLSRLFRHRLQFDDYTDTELEHIFLSFCNRYGYRVTKAAHSKVSRGLQWCRQHDADLFANGRGVWRIFEEAVHHLARRIDGISPQTEELLTTLQNGDITFSGVPAHVLGTGAD